MTFVDDQDVKVTPNLIELGAIEFTFPELDYSNPQDRKVANEYLSSIIGKLNAEFERIKLDREIPVPQDNVRRWNLTGNDNLGLSAEITNFRVVLEDIGDGSIKAKILLVAGILWGTYQGIAAYSDFKVSVQEIIQDVQHVYETVQTELDKMEILGSIETDGPSENQYPTVFAVVHYRKEEEFEGMAIDVARILASQKH